MARYEGIDYTVRKLDFPSWASEALILSNGDGTYTILLNTRYPEDVLRRRLEHELRHLNYDHLHDDVKPIAAKEAEADGLITTPVPAPEEWQPFAPAPEPLPYLESWQRAMAWADRMMKLKTPRSAGAGNL